MHQALGDKKAMATGVAAEAIKSINAVVQEIVSYQRSVDMLDAENLDKNMPWSLGEQ